MFSSICSVRWLVVAAVVGILVGPALLTAQISNPDFEANGSGWVGAAIGWTSFGADKWEGVWDSARVWTQGVSDIPAGNGTCGVYQVVSVTPGAEYRLAVYTRMTSSDLDGAIGVSLSGETDPSVATYGTVTSSMSWTQLTVDFTASAGSITVFLRGRNTKSWPVNDWALFDGVTIEQTGSGGNRPPTAVASGNPLTGDAPLTVNFDGGGSSDPDPGDTLSYDWDFGDNTSASGVTASHLYTEPDVYAVTLTVDDGNGGVDTDTLTVNVTDGGGFPPGTGPNLMANPGFEGAWNDGLAASWQSWSTGGNGYMRQSSRLGRIGSGIYTGTNGYTQTVRLNPKTILLSDLALGHVQALRAALPDAIIIGRLYIDHLAGTYLSDPESYGRLHAYDCYIQHLDKGGGFSAWQGFNEPYMNEVENVRKVARFEKAFAERCHELGLKACVFNIAVGNPAPVENILVQEVVDCLAIADYVGYHAYGGINDQLMVGPEMDWFSLRWRMVKDLYDQQGYRMPPVIYTECTTFYAWKQGYANPWFEPWQIRDDSMAFEGLTKQDDPWSAGMCIFLVGSQSAQWDGWEVADEPVIYEGCGDYNADHPADAWEGLHSQQFGENSGGWTGGIRQAASVTAGKQYRLDHWMKYETYGVNTGVSYKVGYDLTGQTANPGAGSIVFSADLIDGEGRETDWWYDHTLLLTATGSQVSIWFEGSQPFGHDSFRIMVDEVSLRATVPPEDPAIARSPMTLTPSVTEGNDAASEAFTVWNIGGGTLSYSITDDATWLSTVPSGGTSTGEADTIAVNYTTAGLDEGIYNATVTVSDPNATNSPQTVAVTLTVTSSTTYVPPDFDLDNDVDMEDFGHFQQCLGEVSVQGPACEDADFNDDTFVDQNDFGLFQACLTGANTPPEPDCGQN